MVNDEGMPIEQALPEFLEFVGDLPLVAYNAEFDMRFLQIAAMKQGLYVRNPVRCALRLAREAWKGRNSYKLADLARDGGIKDEESHRALVDCKKALIVYSAAASKLGPSYDYDSADLAENDDLPVDEPLSPVEFDGKSFCFTGNFIYGSRMECEGAVMLKSGMPGNLTKKTDYLVIGSYASPEWVTSKAGRKIEKALAMRAAGGKICIINERHWLAHL